MKTDFWKNPAVALCVLIFLAMNSVSAVAETEWTTRSGQSVRGDLVDFDFENKIAVIKGKESGDSLIPTSDLTYDARKKILFASEFHQSFPKKWSMEQSHMLLLCLFVPAILFLVGFWIAGFAFTKRWNPFSAFIGFFGGWIVAVILMYCYFKFAAQSPGNEKALLIAGGFLAVVATSVFVSAIYRCSILTGFYIFASHFFFALFVAIGLNIWLNKKTDPVWLDTASEDYVFRPVGIVGHDISDINDSETAN